MSRYKVSVIIPVYNAEATLARSIRSVLEGTPEGVQLVLVNDGSSDRSADIINEYAGRENVTAVHQENRGVSAARNAGLDAAEGEYICFLDADDILDSDAPERMYACAREHELDMVACDHSETNATIYGGNSGSDEAFVAENDEGIARHLAHLFPKSACAKLFRRSIIDNYSLRFAEDMRLGEDLYFTCGFLLHCTRAGKITGTGVRICNVNPLSLSKRYVPDMADSVVRQLVRWEELCLRYPDGDQSILNTGTDMRLNLCAGYFNNFSKQDCPLSGREKRKAIGSFLREHRELVRNCCRGSGGNPVQRVTRAVIRTRSPLLIEMLFAAKEAMKKRKFEKGRNSQP